MRKNKRKLESINTTFFPAGKASAYAQVRLGKNVSSKCVEAIDFSASSANGVHKFCVVAYGGNCQIHC